MTAPLTPNEVAKQLAALSRELDTVVAALESADRKFVDKKAAAELAYSHAFLAAKGPVDHRKHIANVQTYEIRKDADVADSVVRHLRRRISAIQTRIDVGRSVNSALKAEISLGGIGSGA
jgi:hypothetical protein